MAFEPGAIVQLKSGSPALTVVSATDAEVAVVWFSEETGDFRTHSLPAATLDQIEIEDVDFDEEDDEDEEDGKDD